MLEPLDWLLVEPLVVVALVPPEVPLEEAPVSDVVAAAVMGRAR